MRLRFALVIVAPIIIDSACARSHHAAQEPPAGDVVLLGIDVVIDNRNWQDMVVYAVSDGMKRRLGTVNATTSKSFALDPRFIAHAGEVHFVADPVGERRVFESEHLLLRPGQRVAWTLESNLERSSISIQ